MGGTKTKTAQTTKTEIPAEIRERGTAISNAAMGQYFDPAKKYTDFNSSDPNYQNYQSVGQNTTGQLNQYNQAGGTASQQYNNAATGYQGYFNAANQGLNTANQNNQAGQVSGPNYNSANIQNFMNPYQQNVIDQGVRQIGEGINSQRLNNQSRAAQAGAFGGARHGVVDAEAQKTGAQSLSDFVGTQLSQGFNQAVNQYNTNFGQGLQATNQNNQAKAQNFNQQNSLSQLLYNMGNSDSQNQLAAGNANLNLGNVITQQEQAQKDNAYNKGYIDRRDRPIDIYDRLMGINSMQPINRTSTSTGTQSQSGGWLGPALGAAGSIFASDERAKENIEDVDPEAVLGAFSQVSPKTYTYKDEVLKSHPDLTRPGTRTGFMAQDLERAFNKPSGPTIGGVKTVDIAEVMGNLVAAVHGLEKRTRKFAPKKRSA